MSENVETDIPFESLEDMKGADITDILQVVVLLVFLSFFISTSWMIQDEWITNIVLSATFLFGALCLASIWTLKVVFPFLRPTTNIKMRSWRKPLKLLLGLGVPVLIICQVILSFLFFQRIWIGNLTMIAFIIFVINILRRKSFFEQYDDQEKGASPQ